MRILPLINTGTSPLHVVPALDASDVGWRYPKISIEVEQVGVGVLEIEPMGRCRVSRISPSDRRHR